jgi:predicted membrane protein
MPDLGKIILGGILILLGIIFMIGEIFPGVDTGFFISLLWPLILVAVGISAVIKNLEHPIGGLIIAGLGGLFFINNLLPIDFEIWNFWPLILVAIGVSIILGKESFVNTFSSGADSSDKLNKFIIFWGLEKKMTSKNFQGGEITVIFGGADIDLREAKIAEGGANLTLTTIFGGIDVRLPKDMKLENSGTGILGAFENKTKQDEKTEGGTLNINGTAMFGGVELKN